MSGILHSLSGWGKALHQPDATVLLVIEYPGNVLREFSCPGCWLAFRRGIDFLDEQPGRFAVYSEAKELLFCWEQQ
jgi:hypothetical protein